MARETAAPRHRVLVIDDEESMRLMLARILSKDLKVEVQLAGTCEQALHLAKNYAYDAILLDLLMPGIGGQGVLTEIRRSSANATTPVIVVSQVSEKGLIERCMAAGASAYHAKPVQRDALVKIIRKQIMERTHG